MRLRNLILFGLAALMLASCGSARLGKKKNLTTKDNLKVADKLYEMKSYYNAVEYYEKVLVDKPDDAYAVHQTAESYFQSRDYKKAEPHFKKLVSLSAADYPMAGYRYAETLKMNAKYVEAKKAYKEFGKSYQGLDVREMKKQVKLDVASCDWAAEAMKKKQNLKIIHMDNNVNAAYTEFSPMPMGDSLLMFATLESDSVIKLGTNAKEGGKFHSRIYTVKKDGSQYSNRKKLPSEINDGGYHTGNGVFSLDGKRFYFTKCVRNEEKNVICDIWVSKYKKGKWSAAEKLPEEINMTGYTSTHPAVAPYKRGGEVLYFVSDRPEGKGGMDIWASIVSKGRYRNPINVGNKVNTLRDEITPYYDPTSTALYFSSNGHKGLGGFDVFSTEGMMKKWKPPVNLGNPLNSRVDDMYYVPEASGAGGYFVSNRPGGITPKNETCCDDIYRFEYRTRIIVAVQGYVYDADDSTKTPLDDAAVSLYIDNEDDDEEPLPVSLDSTKSGDMYFFPLVPNKKYKLSAAKKGYFSGKAFFTDYEKVSTMGLEQSDTFRVDLYLMKMELEKAYRLQNIYYDFDKATLRPESKKTLDSLAMIFYEHQDIKVEIGSHTDSKGNDDYNIKLSQKRAESVMRYLILEKKIQPERLIAKGYGETTPIAPNTHPDGSDNPEGRQLNRRTEFKIIGYLENFEYVDPGDEDFNTDGSSGNTEGEGETNEEDK